MGRALGAGGVLRVKAERAVLLGKLGGAEGVEEETRAGLRHEQGAGFRTVFLKLPV